MECTMSSFPSLKRPHRKGKQSIIYRHIWLTARARSSAYPPQKTLLAVRLLAVLITASLIWYQRSFLCRYCSKFIFSHEILCSAKHVLPSIVIQIWRINKKCLTRKVLCLRSLNLQPLPPIISVLGAKGMLAFMVEPSNQDAGGPLCRGLQGRPHDLQSVITDSVGAHQFSSDVLRPSIRLLRNKSNRLHAPAEVCNIKTVLRPNSSMPPFTAQVKRAHMNSLAWLTNIGWTWP